MGLGLGPSEPRRLVNQVGALNEPALQPLMHDRWESSTEDCEREYIESVAPGPVRGRVDGSVPSREQRKKRTCHRVLYHMTAQQHPAWVTQEQSTKSTST